MRATNAGSSRRSSVIRNHELVQRVAPPRASRGARSATAIRALRPAARAATSCATAAERPAAPHPSTTRSYELSDSTPPAPRALPRHHLEAAPEAAPEAGKV